MRVLLDTHVLLWLLTDDPRLSAPSRQLLDAPATIAFISVASWWELTIKQAREPARLPMPVSAVRDAALRSGLRDLEITAAHVLGVASLPPLHRDPFDRLLVAQAIAEPMRLLTADAAVADYAAHVRVLVDRAD